VLVISSVVVIPFLTLLVLFSLAGGRG